MHRIACNFDTFLLISFYSDYYRLCGSVYFMFYVKIIYSLRNGLNEVTKLVTKPFSNNVYMCIYIDLYWNFGMKYV